MQFSKKWLNEFVDKDGNVFHKGKEQPDLKGTLEPTKVKPRKKKKKLTADEKLQRDIKRWNKRKKARRAWFRQYEDKDKEDNKEDERRKTSTRT